MARRRGMGVASARARSSRWPLMPATSVAGAGRRPRIEGCTRTAP
jgi:hypothetical protein